MVIGCVVSELVVIGWLNSHWVGEWAFGVWSLVGGNWMGGWSFGGWSVG